MILFNDTISIPGLTINNSLAYVYNCDIDSSRVQMSCVVQFILLQNAETDPPNYTPYFQISYPSIPYDPNSNLMPAAQAYNWLMEQPDYSEGSVYPA